MNETILFGILLFIIGCAFGAIVCFIVVVHMLGQKHEWTREKLDLERQKSWRK